MSLDHDAKELRAKLSGEIPPHSQVPSWTGNWDQYDADWNTYWNLRMTEVWAPWFVAMKKEGGPSQADREALTDRRVAYAEEKFARIHPELAALKPRRITGQLNETDVKMAVFRFSYHPETALGPDKKVRPGWTGFSGPRPIQDYQDFQKSVAAFKGYIDCELARRRLERLTPEQVSQAWQDYEKYKDFASDNPENPLPWPSYPPPYHWINTAHTWGGHMTDERLKNALAWYTMLCFGEITGDTSPRVNEPGHIPLPPLEDPHWQDVEYAQLQKRADKRGRKED